MKFFRFVVVLWIAMASQGFAAEKTIILATVDWTPYVGKNLPDNGFLSKIVTTALERTGYSVEIKYMPWATILKAVENGKVDAFFPAYYSEERTVKFVVSESFFTGPLYLCKLKSNKIVYSTLEDLKPYKIGVVRGYLNTPEFDSADYLNKKKANSDKLNLVKLIKKRVDIVVVDKYAALQIVKESIPDAIGAIDFLEPPLEEKTLHLVFSRKNKNCQAIVDGFNTEIKILTEDGSVKKIIRKYGFQ